jgi:hypothetical protein
MKRISFILLTVLCFILAACAGITPQPVVDAVSPLPAVTSTLPEQVVEMATPTIEPAAAEADPPPPAQMPPLDSGGWHRVGEKLPFTFELPDGWITPDGYIVWAPYWIPAGQPPVNGTIAFGVNEVEMTAEQEDLQTWPQNSAVESRTPIEVNGETYSLVKVIVYNGEGGTASAYEMHAIIPMPGMNKVYGIYATAPTQDDRAALEDILVHAVESLEFVQ